MESFAYLRKKERLDIDIPVVITTILTSEEATIINLSEDGALVIGPTVVQGNRVQIDYEGQTVYGIVAWAEPDRFGVRFPFSLSEGPLYERLMQAKTMKNIASAPHWRPAPVRTSSRPSFRPVAAGFGRRQN